MDSREAKSGVKPPLLVHANGDGPGELGKAKEEKEEDAAVGAAEEKENGDGDGEEEPFWTRYSSTVKISCWLSEDAFS